MNELTKKLMAEKRVQRCISNAGYLPSKVTDIEKEEYFPQWNITTYLVTYESCEKFFIAIPYDKRKAVKYEPLNA